MDLHERAGRFAALGDPVRLAIVDDLAVSDRTPGELAERHGLGSNLLAHHLSVLDRSRLIDRLPSSGDRRRRYVRLRPGALQDLALHPMAPVRHVLFVCTRNSARSQLAAAAWVAIVGTQASSAGTHPADRVHAGAIAAAERGGLDLTGARPRLLSEVHHDGADLVVTVCDRAHEEMEPDDARLHWSVADPVDDPTAAAFDTALADLSARIRHLTEGTAA